MKLVEDEKWKVLGSVDQMMAILVSRQDQLEHDVIREQDVGRVLPDGLLLLLLLLARVLGKADAGLGRNAMLEELLEFLLLAIRQRVHRIDDDRLNALPQP